MNKANEKAGIHCFVSGKVQGVWYRASTKEEAVKLGLTGWAKNLPDGRVEVLAFGEEQKLHELFEWLKHGPERAEVSNITRADVPWQEYSGFDTK